MSYNEVCKLFRDAIYKDDIDQLNKLFLEEKFDFEGSYLLHWAIEIGNPEVIELLLQKGARVNGVDHYNTTPLMLAAKYVEHEIIEILMKAGADPTLQDKAGKTAYIYAIEQDFPTGRCALLVKTDTESPEKIAEAMKKVQTFRRVINRTAGKYYPKK